MRAAASLSFVAPVLALLVTEHPAEAARPKATGTLVEYLRGREDLAPRERRRWESELRKVFGKCATAPAASGHPELAVARSIISSAIFQNADPVPGVSVAWQGWQAAASLVPPPIAIHYARLLLQGRKPANRAMELALKFPDSYAEEIAPELVAYWEDALRAGTVPDEAREATRQALEATRLKMRPLLLDRLRVLARLDRELRSSRGLRRAEVERDLKEVDDELARSFANVPLRPEVLDSRKRPFDRLRIELEDRGLTPTEEDRFLDPDTGPPPRRPVPIELVDVPQVLPGDANWFSRNQYSRGAVPKGAASAENAPPLTEPDRPALPLIPDQPRAGDPDVETTVGRAFRDVMDAYQHRLESAIAPWLRTPYVFGAATKGSGTDASGFTKAVFATAFGLDLPRLARDQFRFGISVSREDLRPGDLVFFDPLDSGRVSHVGVYAGDGKLAHASLGRGVLYARLDEPYFLRAYRGARRLLVYPEAR